MSVSYYDNALYNKIQGWVKDKNVRVLSPDDSLRMFQLRADLNRDQPISLPCVAISRLPKVHLDCTHRKPITFDGFMIAKPEPPEGMTEKEQQEWLDKLYDENKAVSLQVNAIPMTLRYQIDIYAKEMSTVDEYVRNFVFNLINHPKLMVELPYQGVNYQHECNIYMDEDSEDNSDIPSRLFKGQFYRWTISLTIDDANMFSIPVENLVRITDSEVRTISPESSDDEDL